MKIVLAHGVLGFGEVIPGDWQIVKYFNGVKEHLEQRFPNTEVFEPSVDPKGSIETRGPKLAEAIGNLGAPVHVIAHSMGGLDARWAIAKRPEQTKNVLSLVTIGTPHRGSEVADAIVDRRPPLFSALPGFVVRQLEANGPALDVSPRPAARYSTTPRLTGRASPTSRSPATPRMPARNRCCFRSRRCWATSQGSPMTGS